MTSSGTTSLLEELGGVERLHAIIDDFINRVVSDMMIGFYFRGVDIQRLKRREFEFARMHLGQEGEYSGRPLKAAHQPRKIMGGHFDRRLVILEKTLRKHGISEHVIENWLEHNRKLRSQITRDAKGECIG